MVRPLHPGKVKKEEEKVKDKVFSIVVAPINEAGYANLYARDITEVKKNTGDFAYKRGTISSCCNRVAFSDNDFTQKTEKFYK